MPYYAVFNARGPAWDQDRPMREQDAWAEHAAFMDRLVDDGFLRVGGPVGDGHPFQALHLVEADSADAVRTRLAADPWAPMGILHTARVDPWEILLGAVPVGS